jgi:carbonic anhydrase/acetyltransferase-like protein (isoleucine patch superfamily)
MLIRHREQEPVVEPSAYLAPTATLVGDVRIGPRARVMYGAVLDAEDGVIEVGESAVICENAVLRGAVTLGDHVFVGPHATLLGCTVARCVYLATGATVLQQASLGAGAVVAIGAAVHAKCVLPEEFFVPPNNVAIAGRVYAPGDPGLPDAIRQVNFAATAFGVEAEWTDRINRYERIAEVRAEQFGAHRQDTVLDRPS